jgi:hypothetical protein
MFSGVGSVRASDEVCSCELLLCSEEPVGFDVAVLSNDEPGTGVGWVADVSLEVDGRVGSVDGIKDVLEALAETLLAFSR